MNVFDPTGYIAGYGEPQPFADPSVLPNELSIGGYNPLAEIKKKVKPINLLRSKIDGVQTKKIEEAQSESERAYAQMIAQHQGNIAANDQTLQGLYAQQPGFLAHGALPTPTQATPTLGESLTQGLAGIFRSQDANQVNAGFAKTAQERAAQQDQFNGAAYNQAEQDRALQLQMLQQKIAAILQQRGATQNDLSSLEQFHVGQLAQNERNDANIQRALATTGMNNQTRQTVAGMNIDSREGIAYMKTPEGKYERAIQMGMDPDEALQNYQAETGKIRIKQDIDARRASAYENNLKSMAEYRIGQLNLGKERNKISREAIAAAFQRAKLSADTRITTAGMMIDAAGQRQLIGQEFDRELYNMGLKMPQGWNYESPEQKVIHDKMDHLYKALEGYQDDDLKYGTADNASKIQDVQKQIDALQKTYLDAGVKRPLAPAPAGGK